MTDRAWVATRKGLFEMRRQRDGWTIAHVSFLGEPVSMLLPPIPSGRMFAALNLGHFGVKVHASDDGGRHWQEVTTPAYPAQPAQTKGPAWKLVQIWSFAAQGDTVWAGTLPGGLFRSDDGGVNWQLNESLWQQPGRTEWFGGGYDVPGIQSICLHPERSTELLVGISCGGVWRSCDEGRTWTAQTRGMRAVYMPPEQAENPNAQDPHCVVRCASHPDVLWTQHHNGIWRSTNNAKSWEEIITAPLSNFGFAVAAHPSRADTAWLVPAVADQQRVPVAGALAVNRTTDGGMTFETLREGLPQSSCYDLVYRHGLAVANDGQHLMMGSTTGGLWSSADAGDSWSEVTHLLPPVYAVRFG